MKLNTISLAAACSLLIIASHSSQARSLRADEGNGSGWDTGTQLSISSTYSVGSLGLTLTPNVPGVGTTVSSPVLVNYNASLNTTLAPLNDVSFQNGGNGLYAMSPSVLYNWYTGTGFPSNLQANTQDQIAVYTLADNSSNANNLLAGQPSLANDVEVEFNYTDKTTASFTFGGYKYTSTGAVPDADFLFTSSGSFLGTLIDHPTDANDLNSGVSLVSASDSASLQGWTRTPTVSAPEMDSSTTASALTLLGGALLVLRGWLRPRERHASV
jgi:hypothetical protein